MKLLAVLALTLVTISSSFAMDFREKSLYASTDLESEESAEIDVLLESVVFITSNKSNVKRRAAPYKGYRQMLAIESNFEVPMYGEDDYFGRIYLTSSETEIRYRDELIAERHYDEEAKKLGTFYTSSYKIADVNSSAGLKLVDAAGALVRLKTRSGKFSTKTGGALNLYVDHPLDSSFSLDIDIAISATAITNNLVVAGKKYAFDTIKIKAGSMGISMGISAVEFLKAGSVVYTQK